MSSKRKNNDFPLSIYDQAWLFAFYRWLRWDRVQIMTVYAPPEKCQRWIENLMRGRGHGKQQMSNGLYEFQIALFTNGTKPTDVGVVTGQIIAATDEGYSRVMLRAYPGVMNTGCAGTLTAIGMLMACGSITNIVPFQTVLEGVCGSLIMLAIIAIAWLMPFSGRDEALDIVATTFTNTNDHSRKTKRKVS